MIPCGVRSRRPASAMQRAQNAELARLLLDGKYSPEQAPPVDAVSGQQVSLCVGSEQRLDAGGRVYFLDHGKRTTAWADPRMEDDATDDPPLPTSTQDDLQLLLSGVLPDMAVGPADLRHALHKAVRHALQRAEAEAAEDSSSLTGVHHERRLLLQQQVHLSLLERMQGTHDTRSANSDLAHATSLCYAVFNVGRAAEPEPQPKPEDVAVTAVTATIAAAAAAAAASAAPGKRPQPQMQSSQPPKESRKLSLSEYKAAAIVNTATAAAAVTATASATAAAAATATASATAAASTSATASASASAFASAPASAGVAQPAMEGSQAAPVNSFLAELARKLNEKNIKVSSIMKNHGIE